MRWYYFIRADNKLLPRRDGGHVPRRPADANPDNGDPLTPWYETTDHLDDEHIHVLAESSEDAADKARTLARLDREAKESDDFPCPQGMRVNLLIPGPQ